MHIYSKVTTTFFNDDISSWESKELPDEKITTTIISSYSIAPRLV